MKGFRHESKLIAIPGSLAGETFYCDQDIISIGRDSANDIQLKDSSVSACHCVIRRQAHQYWIKKQNKKGVRPDGMKQASPTVS